MKKTSALLFLVLLGIQAMQISAVQNTVAYQASLGDGWEGGENTDYPPIVPVEEDDYQQCEFPVVVEERDPNCTNIDELISITEQQVQVLISAIQLTIKQLEALRESYNFIDATCEDGVWGVPNIKPVALLQVADKFMGYDNQAHKLIPSTDLIEKKALKALLAASELMEDAPHCTEEEIEEKCLEYRRETNETIRAHEEFLEQLQVKYNYLYQRIEILRQWKTDNYQFCRCSNPNIYSPEECCVPNNQPFTDTQECQCYNHFTEENCCDLPEYASTLRCTCYEHLDPEACCPLQQYESLPECTCRTEFTVDKCCGLDGYKNDTRCLCDANFTTDLCCGLEAYSSLKNCTCRTNFIPVDCCPIYENDPSCFCELGWDTNYCCDIEKYQQDPKCVCKENFTTTPCCSVGGYESHPECLCIQSFDYTTCCQFPAYANDTHCQCQDNFDATTCCSLDEHKLKPECVCRDNATFTIEPCCDFTDFQNRKECKCAKQDNAFDPLDCCDQPKWIDTHDCACKRQCHPTNPYDCCNVTIYENQTECKCKKQDNPISPINCCAYEPFVNDPQYEHICACQAQTVAIDDAFNPPRNCCDTDRFSNSSRCQCAHSFTSDACCQFPEYANQRECLCREALVPFTEDLDCCDLYDWDKDKRCICKNQEDSMNPHHCCDQPQFANDHNCKCEVQTNPITLERNCCDTTYHNETQECKCYAQETHNSPDNCCGYEPFIGSFECLCEAQTLPYDPQGYNCCNLTGFASHTQCQCQVEFNADKCCQYDEFRGHKECQCKQLDVPFNSSLDCCDQPRWENDTRCYCKDKKDQVPFDLTCCDIYSDNINCRCRNVDQVYPGHLDCCDADKFKDNKDCDCYPQFLVGDGPLTPNDCCDREYFETHQECICRNVELPITPAHNCCNLAEYENHQQCLCVNDFDAEKCCGYTNFQDEHECICRKKTVFDEDCCDVAPWNNDPRCTCKTTFVPNTCCDYAPWNDDEKVCRCQRQSEPVQPENCCDQVQFNETKVCSCLQPNVNNSDYYCCDQPLFNDTLECICQNKHALPIFDGYNCCTLDAHKNDILCQCQHTLDTEKCCGYAQFSGTTECMCKDGELSPTECCDQPGYENHIECKCKKDFDPETCCGLSDYNDRRECQCRAQQYPDTPLDCCNETIYVNEHRCICQNPVGSPSDVQSDGDDCCDISSYTTHKDCICKYQAVPIFNGTDCCEYNKFSDHIKCRCLAQEEATEECCDHNPNFTDTLVCKCKNVPIPFTDDLDCCSLPKFENHTQCKCFHDFSVSECCGYEPFSNNRECQCYQQENSHTPDNCCDQPKWANDSWCACQGQVNETSDPTSPKYCCDILGDNSHLCQCSKRVNETEVPEECCDTKYFNTSLECKCQGQEHPYNPNDCCSLRPGNNQCICRDLTFDISVGNFNCCTLAEHANDHECQCYNSFNPDACCQYTAFQDRHECICKTQTYPIEGDSNCCDQSKFSGNHTCKCNKQSIENPTTPENCCDLSPWSDTIECLCKAQYAANSSNPFLLNGTSCCNIESGFNSHPACYCPKLQNPTGDEQCCTLSEYSTTKDCVCNFYQEEPIVEEPEGFNCCEYPHFQSTSRCRCEANIFTPDECCDFSSFELDPRCPTVVPSCEQQYLLGELNTTCCEQDYLGDPLCCIYKETATGPGWDCCNSPKFITTDFCRCRKQEDPITEELNCCTHPKFEGNHECACRAQTLGINYETELYCCDVDGFESTKECKCEHQVNVTNNPAGPETCCDIGVYQNHHECVCQRQAVPFIPNVPGSDCCDSSRWNGDYRCVCRDQESLTSPYDCCVHTEYMSETECKCQSQTNALTPLDCCSSDKFKNTPVCKCRNGFELTEECCEVYPNNEACKCLTDFIIPKCCTYNPNHEGCGGTYDCYENDTSYNLDFEGIVVENYYLADHTIAIIEGLVFFNPLLNSDSNTTTILETDPFTIDANSITENGLAGNSDSNTVFPTELPWEGTFSVNVFINKTAAQGDVIVWSNGHFKVVLNAQEDTVVYTVQDLSGNQLLTLTTDVETPNTNWWTHLTGAARTEFFNALIPQKVELAFAGRDCWLTVIGINDKVTESGVWGCLVPESSDIGDIATSNNVEVRKHFGTFHLGDSTNAEGAISFVFVYMVGGNQKSLKKLTPLIVVGDGSNAPTTLPAGFCEIAFDWSHISILPGGSNCAAVSTNSAYGAFSGASFSHSFGYIPPIQYCQNLIRNPGDFGTKHHICEQDTTLATQGVSVAAGSTVNLNLLDLVVLSTSFEDYNPTIALNGDADNADIWLVADNEAGIRTVVAPELSGTVSSINSVSFGFNLSVVSFPYNVLNAKNADPTAEIVFNVRLFGQKTVSVVFHVRREGEGFKVSRSFQGALKDVNDVANITTDEGIQYGGDVSFTWTAQAFDAAISDSLATDETSTAWSGQLADESSSEIEVSFQTYLSYGPTHGYFQPTDFIADRNAVFKLSGFRLEVTSSAVPTPTTQEEEEEEETVYTVTTIHAEEEEETPVYTVETIHAEEEEETVYVTNVITTEEESQDE